ncbi:general stress protein [Microbacterium radiodurans]|uniref:general stress protein n=1 Tax=Microbacterium radiodurans TaxID=661398 RepID=UPI00168B3D6F|nr:general stress protein [Microbacterium radiodurans]
MSMMSGTPPVAGEKVAEFASYEGAQKAVSKLIAADIPAREIAIVGTGLRSVETVTGRLGYATAARTGAINGILLGLVFSLIFVFGTPDAAIQLFLGVMLVGVAVGMATSLVMFALVRRRRDFASVTQVVADHYEVTVQSGSIHRARGALNTAPTAAAAPAPHPATAEPPRYGERVDPVPAPPADRPAPGPDAPPAGGPAAPPTGPAAPPTGPAVPPTGPAAPPAPGPSAPRAGDTTDPLPGQPPAR